MKESTNDEKIGVSVICNTYNHEKYIAKTLNSILEQRTEFVIEVLVHDDASTDKTADIIRDFQYRFPDIIQELKENILHFVREMIIGMIHINCKNNMMNWNYTLT